MPYPCHPGLASENFSDVISLGSKIESPSYFIRLGIDMSRHGSNRHESLLHDIDMKIST